MGQTPLGFTSWCLTHIPHLPSGEYGPDFSYTPPCREVYLIKYLLESISNTLHPKVVLSRGGQGFLVIGDLAQKKVGEMVIWALKNWLFGDF